MISASSIGLKPPYESLDKALTNPAQPYMASSAASRYQSSRRHFGGQQVQRAEIHDGDKTKGKKSRNGQFGLFDGFVWT
jgi:hypothetical protein